MVLSNRPANVMANAFSAGFHLMVQRALPPPVGSRDLATRYRHFSAAFSFGKCPLALTALRYRAVIDSIAFVVQIIRRISTSYSRKGTNSAQEDSHSRTIAGYW